MRVRERAEGEQGRAPGLGGNSLSPGLPGAKRGWVGLGFRCESSSLGGPRQLKVREGPCQEIRGSPWVALSIVPAMVRGWWRRGSGVSAKLSSRPGHPILGLPPSPSQAQCPPALLRCSSSQAPTSENRPPLARCLGWPPCSCTPPVALW